MDSDAPARPDGELAADKLANVLFLLFVLRDEHTLFRELRQRCELSPAFRGQTFEFQVFVFLVASIAVVLTNEYARQTNSAKAISALRQLVHEEVVQRGVESTEAVDDAIEEAAAKLGDLLYRKPNAESDLSWAQEWLQICGVEESNPAVLLNFAQQWKLQNIALAKSVSETRIG
jgi:hypothetical protein